MPALPSFPASRFITMKTVSPADAGRDGGHGFPGGAADAFGGDMLFLYTDGVTEAMNEAKKIFTEERLQQTLAALSAGQSSAETLAAVRDAVGWTGSLPQRPERKRTKF